MLAGGDPVIPAGLVISPEAKAQKSWDGFDFKPCMERDDCFLAQRLRCLRHKSIGAVRTVGRLTEDPKVKGGNGRSFTPAWEIIPFVGGPQSECIRFGDRLR